MDDKKLFLAFGRRVQQLRKQKRWSQEQLAEAIGRTRDAVSNIERGVNGTHIKVAYLIATALEVSLADLFEFGSVGARDRERRQLENKLLVLLHGRDARTLQQIHSLIETALEIGAGDKMKKRKSASS